MPTLAEQFRAEGAEKGKLEGKLEDARNLLELGVSLEIVLKATGLSIEELRKAGLVKSQ